MKSTHPTRKKNQVRALAEYFLHKGQIRNHVLVVLGLVPHQARILSDSARIFVVRRRGKAAGMPFGLSRHCRVAWRQKDRLSALDSCLMGLLGTVLRVSDTLVLHKMIKTKFI